VTPDAETPRRVLFVEDEPGLRRAYQRYFGTRYQIALAGSGEEARLQLTSLNPDVMVLDLNLPDTDGIDLLREFRAQHEKLAVIITTSYASMEPLVEVLGIKHSGYLVKPFDLGDLNAQIDAVG
jgi:DNA-binding response OmpR family regulator